MVGGRRHGLGQGEFRIDPADHDARRAGLSGNRLARALCNVESLCRIRTHGSETARTRIDQRNFDLERPSGIVRCVCVAKKSRSNQDIAKPNGALDPEEDRHPVGVFLTV